MTVMPATKEPVCTHPVGGPATDPDHLDGLVTWCASRVGGVFAARHFDGLPCRNGIIATGFPVHAPNAPHGLRADRTWDSCGNPVAKDTPPPAAGSAAAAEPEPPASPATHTMADPTDRALACFIEDFVLRRAQEYRAHAAAGIDSSSFLG